jgi:dTDP-4-amino-4,6-dideoxygalactose transaminase
MKFKRTLSPSGAPIYLKDLISGLFGMMRPAKTLEKFEDELRSHFGVKHVFLLSSGTAALTLILKSLSEITGRTEVVIPSYTCFSVPSAVVKAGSKPVICDVSGHDFNYGPERLKETVGKETSCIIATHLFGIPCDLEAIRPVAHSAGSYVVEDCAQAMGAELNGKKVGTMGDVGFFSLGRGKNLSTVSGGIIITNDDAIAKKLAEKCAVLKSSGMAGQMRSFLVALFLFVFSRPSLYWFPSGLPFLGIGKTVFSTKFSIEKLAGFNAGLASDWKAKLEAFNRKREISASAYRNKLGSEGIALVEEPSGAVPAYLRFPVIAASPEKRDAICEKLASAGLGASSNYPTGIAEIPELEITQEQKADCRQGCELARRILTLPTHTYVSDQDIEAIAGLLGGMKEHALHELAPVTTHSRDLSG